MPKISIRKAMLVLVRVHAKRRQCSRRARFSCKGHSSPDGGALTGPTSMGFGSRAGEQSDAGTRVDLKANSGSPLGQSTFVQFLRTFPEREEDEREMS